LNNFDLNNKKSKHTENTMSNSTTLDPVQSVAAMTASLVNETAPTTPSNTMVADSRTVVGDAGAVTSTCTIQQDGWGPYTRIDSRIINFRDGNHNGFIGAVGLPTGEAGAATVQGGRRITNTDIRLDGANSVVLVTGEVNNGQQVVIPHAVGCTDQRSQQQRSR
jgi:hypothetical protein